MNQNVSFRHRTVTQLLVLAFTLAINARSFAEPPMKPAKAKAAPWVLVKAEAQGRLGYFPFPYSGLLACGSLDPLAARSLCITVRLAEPPGDKVVITTSEVEVVTEKLSFDQFGNATSTTAPKMRTEEQRDFELRYDKKYLLSFNLVDEKDSTVSEFKGYVCRVFNDAKQNAVVPVGNERTLICSWPLDKRDMPLSADVVRKCWLMDPDGFGQRLLAVGKEAVRRADKKEKEPAPADAKRPAK